MSNPITRYSAPGEDEQFLKHETVNEAIEEYLDEISDSSENWHDGRPVGKIEIQCWAVREVGDFLDGSILDLTLDSLYQAFSTDYSEFPETTNAMREAEAAFIKVIKAEYNVPSMECVETVTVDAEDWVMKHRPDWIEDDE